MNYADPSKPSTSCRIDFNAYPANARNFKSVTNQGNPSKVEIMTNTPNVSFTTSLFTTYNMNLNDSKQPKAPKGKKVFESKTETNAKEPTKSTGVRNKMYHCEFCDTCTKQKNRKGLKRDNDEVHYNGKCVWISSSFCSICGLKFTDDIYQSHRASHKRYKLDIPLHKFYRWQDEQLLMKAPVPRYPYCNKCKVYYLPLTNMGHDHSKSKVRCDICKKVYDYFTYELHKNFHKTNMSSKDGSTNLDREKGEPLIDKSENISIGVQGETVIDFFRCKICSATYHVKGYIARHNCETPLRHCKQCNMLIPAPHYKKHTELHDRYNDTHCRGTITEFEN